MKTIKYQMEQNGSLLSVEMDYNEKNLEIAERESYNGEYEICDDEGGEA